MAQGLKLPYRQSDIYVYIKVRLIQNPKKTTIEAKLSPV